MTYEEVLTALDDYRHLGSVYGLDSIRRLMDGLEHPEEAIKIIHVAGTNGKGSTVTTLATILETCGIHTASYTSPEVTTYLDRFRIGLVPASEADFILAYTRVEAVCQSIVQQGHPHPTIFEMELAMAYVLARHCHAEVMLQETGLGGRLDATNVVQHPSLVVFTAIGMDHTQFLGDTLEAIAKEKAAIIKPGAAVVSYNNGPAVNAIIAEAAAQYGLPCDFSSPDRCQVVARTLQGQDILYNGNTYHYPLIGTHQLHNFALIMQAVDTLRAHGWVLPVSQVQEALLKVYWPGRFEVVCNAPVVVLDGAHNPQAAKALCETVQAWFPERRVHFLMHIFKDKDAAGILEAIAPVCAQLTLTTIDEERSTAPQQLLDIARQFIPENALSINLDFSAAIHSTLEQLADDDILIICGSLSHLEASRRHLAQSERISFTW